LRQLRDEYREADKRLENIAEEIVGIETKQRERDEEYSKLRSKLSSDLEEQEDMPGHSIKKDEYSRYLGEDRSGHDRFRHLDQWMQNRKPSGQEHRRQPVFLSADEADLLSFQRYTKEELGEATSAYSAILHLQQRANAQQQGYLEHEQLPVAFLAHKFRVYLERGRGAK
jgi:hypothetical protein